jgi:uncharacterized protein GlcG (DUF336 family)
MFVAESKRLTHQGAKMIMATAVELAGQANIAISCAIVDSGGHLILIERVGRECIGGVGVSGGDWETDLRIARMAVESIGANWE